MSGLFRFGGASGNYTTASTAAQPDFSAFDDDDDDEDAQPLTGRGRHGDDHAHDGESRSINTERSASSYAITLDNAFEDPLTQSQPASAVSHHHQPQPPTSRIPGGYDFEPQPHQGGGGGSGTSASSPASSRRNSDAPWRPATHNSAAAAPARSSSSSSTPTPTSFSQRFMPAALLARLGQNRDGNGAGDRQETSGLLFESSAEDTEADDDEDRDRRREAYPPQQPSHVPLPARPPQFGAGPTPNATAGNVRVFGGGQGNDGVFANLSAKPDGMRGADYVGGEDGDDNKDEVLPAYEIAAMDTTPPYWETTVITPGGVLGPDDICVDGLPVGNMFGFAWNLLVSMSFQFVGFLLTYLLHTTHAAKNGSRAGLGVTLIQLGFYLKERADHPERFLLPPGDRTGLDGALGPNGNGLNGHHNVHGTGLVPADPNTSWSWWGGAIIDDEAEGSGAVSSALSSMATSTMTALGSLPTQINGALSGAFDASDPDSLAALRNGTSNGMPSLLGGGAGVDGAPTQAELIKMGQAANEWMAFMMICIGSFLIIGAVLSYWRAVRWAKAVRSRDGPQQDSESQLNFGRWFAQA